MSFLRPLTRNFSVHSPKFLLLRTDRSACCVSLYLSLWHLPWIISPQNKNRWIYILSHQPEQNMKRPRSPLIAFCFSKLGHLNISNNRAIAHNVKGERETFRKGVCDLPGLQKALQQCPIVPLLDPSLSLSHLMNGAIGRRPAAAKVQSVSSQCKLRLLPRLICTSYPTARHNNSATQCNNSSVAGKGIWVTGFL